MTIPKILRLSLTTLLILAELGDSAAVREVSWLETQCLAYNETVKVLAIDGSLHASYGPEAS